MNLYQPFVVLDSENFNSFTAASKKSDSQCCTWPSTQAVM